MIPEGAGYHGDGSYADALLLAAVSNTPVVGYHMTRTNNTPQRSIPIPEAAVEAAARAFREGRRRGDLGDALMAALEAAAPHMLEDAWDTGAEAMERSAWPDGDLPNNPYRTTT